MSVTTGQVVVGTTPVQIDGNDINPVRIYIHNLDSTKELFVGSENVTISDGYVINKNSEMNFELPAAGAIYMVSSAATHNVSWMRIAHY